MARVRWTGKQRQRLFALATRHGFPPVKVPATVEAEPDWQTAYKARTEGRMVRQRHNPPLTVGDRAGWGALALEAPPEVLDEAQEALELTILRALIGRSE